MGLGHLWDQFFVEEADIAVAEAVVLIAAVEAGLLRVGVEGWHDAGIDEDAEGGWHVARGDEAIEDISGLETAGLVDEASAVLKDHECVAILRCSDGGDIDPIVANGAREMLARLEAGFGDRSLARLGEGGAGHCSLKEDST